MATVKLDPAKGVQIPNMTTTERDAVSSPETGAIIWNTTTSEINQYNGSAWEITYTDTNTQIAGITSSADATAITINSSEQVGVGTTSPSVKTEIQHSGTGGFPATSGTAQTYGILRLNSGGGWTSALDIGNNGGNGAWIQSTDTSNLATNYALYINKNGGQVRVGSGGITFNGDTTAANALDDYEEGTWTPTLGGTTSNPTTSYYQQRGYYIKIGQLVHFEVFVQTSSTSGGSGTLTIEGLPFTVANAGSWDQSVATVMYHYLNRSGTDPQVTGEITNNDTRVLFMQSYDNSAVVGVTTTALTADGSWVRVSGNYRAA